MPEERFGILQLPKFEDPRGALTVIEGGRQIPFEIRRVYYVYDVPGGSERAGHAHKRLQQFIVAMSGSFDVKVDDGRTQRAFSLNRSYFGLYIGPLVWRTIDNFSSGSVCLVLASEHFDESDYYRNYADFLAAVRGSAP